MKGLNSSEIFETPRFVKVTAFSFISLAIYYFCNHHFSNSPLLQVTLSPTTSNPQNNISVSAGAPNSSSIISNQTLDSSILVPTPPPPPAKELERTGIVDQNGAMSTDFKIGDFDENSVEEFGNFTVEEQKRHESGANRVKVKRFGVCDQSMREHIPCLDNVEEISKLNSTERGEKYERHCPGEGKGLNCVVPVPQGYKIRIPWPKSRDEVSVCKFCNRACIVSCS